MAGKPSPRKIVDAILAAPPDSEAELSRRLSGADPRKLVREITERIERESDSPILLLLLLSNLAGSAADDLLEILGDSSRRMPLRVFAFIALANVGRMPEELEGEIGEIADRAVRLMTLLNLPPESPWGALLELDPSDEDAVLAGLDRLAAEFAASEEGRALAGPDVGHWAYGLMRHAYDSFDEFAFGIDGPVAEEILFDMFPRQAVVRSMAEAEAIVPELRAFWQWTVRHTNAPAAEEVFEVLDQAAVELPAMMLDDRNFGPAKAFVMAGERAGFDMNDPEQFETFAVNFNAATRGLDVAKTKDAEGRKRKSAMEKASRKRNRRRK